MSYDREKHVAKRDVFGTIFEIVTDTFNPWLMYWCMWASAGVALQLKPFKVWEVQGEIPPAPPPFKNLLSLSPFYIQ